MLVSLCAVCTSTLSVSAAQGSANVQAPTLVGASVGGAPAVCAPDANSLALFARGTDGALWYEHWDGTTWSVSMSLGGVLTSDPAATSSATGHIDVCVRGSDNALWQKTTTNGGSSWSAWTSLGGQIPSGTGPAVCAQGSRLDVFVQGTDGALWHKWYTGTSWSGWQSLSGKLTSSPAATSPASGVIDVCVRGSDNALWQKTTTNGGSSWSAWTSLGGQIPSGTGPAVCAQGSRLDVFVQGTDGALWHKWYTGTSWSGWQSLSGKLTSSPAATSPASGVIDVCVRGSDNALWEKTYNGVWSGWTSIGGMSQTQRKLFATFPRQEQRGPTRGRQASAIMPTSAPPAYFKPNQTASRIGAISGKMILSTSRRAA